MHAIEDSVVALAAYLLGLATAHILSRLGRAAKGTEESVDTQGEAEQPIQIRCGACQSPVLAEKPLTVVLSSTGSFKLFRCQQCGTNLTIPL